LLLAGALTHGLAGCTNPGGRPPVDSPIYAFQPVDPDDYAAEDADSDDGDADAADGGDDASED
jgi:hypothetical protein